MVTIVKSLIRQKSWTCRRPQGHRIWIRVCCLAQKNMDLWAKLHLNLVCKNEFEYSCQSREESEEKDWLMVGPLQSEESKHVKEHTFLGSQLVSVSLGQALSG